MARTRLRTLGIPTLRRQRSSTDDPACGPAWHPRPQPQLPPVNWRAATLALLGVVVTIALPSCVKDTTFNPYAAPDHAELDRLQTVINQRPDLQTAQRQLTDLDAKIRAAVAKYAPQTVMSPSSPKLDRGCTDPYTHNIGDTFTMDTVYARPAPSAEQFDQITAALTPILTAANFKINSPANVVPPSGTFSQISDDGSTVELINSPNTVLVYGYSTGCRLPAAWRTSPPPPDQRPPDDPDIHYPYLFSTGGGRRS